uniref:Cyclic pyranopterin monophosphate synthase MoaC n=1 Tax=Ignisphaera aggregans TaxID=334771 RepID=A0A7C4BDG3_9CREN
MSVKMADVSGKEEVSREAVAMGCIRLRRETIERIRGGGVEKGDVVTATSVVAIASAKLTHVLLPFCHPIKIDYVEPRVTVEDDGVCVEVLVRARERTGVEMEALTAVAIALLNVWDMVKKYEKDEKGLYPYTEITSIRVVEKVKKV